MDKKAAIKDVLTVFLIVLLFIVVWQLSVVNNNFHLSQNKLQSIQAEIGLQKKQHDLQIQGLNSEIEFRNKNLEAANRQLVTTIQQLETAKQELTLAKSQLEELNTLKAETANLSHIKQELEQKIADLENENQAAQAKLHSLTELRKLVRQAKAEIHEQKIQHNLEKKYRQKAADGQESSRGNRGFIIKNSKSTYKNAVRIEVKPGN